MAFGNGPYIVTNGLVLALDAADRNSYVSGSTTWTDLAGGNNGTLTNGPTFDSGSGGSIVFDGTNDSVQISHNSIFNFTTGLTIGAWYKSSDIIDAYIATKNDDSFYLCIGPTGTTSNKMSFFLNGTTGGWLQSSANAATNNWTYVTTTWTAGVSSIYLNGTLDISASRPGTLQTGSNNVVIGLRPLVSNPYTGNIASVQMYNRALSATEILQNYNATKSRFNL